jgi:hypothetical protein
MTLPSLLIRVVLLLKTLPESGQTEELRNKKKHDGRFWKSCHNHLGNLDINVVISGITAGITPAKNPL